MPALKQHTPSNSSKANVKQWCSKYTQLTHTKSAYQLKHSVARSPHTLGVTMQSFNELGPDPQRTIKLHTEQNIVLMHILRPKHIHHDDQSNKASRHTSCPCEDFVAG
eukprot:1148146-Pelagomonas_calceolata.AAC.2